MSNVVQLQRKRSALEESVQELADWKPSHWLVIGYDQEMKRITVAGPPELDVVISKGMLQTASDYVEEIV